MATALKHIYNPSFFEMLCPVLKECIPDFDCRDFVFRIFNNRWPDLELKHRVRHITTVLHQMLPSEFNLAVVHILAISKRLEAKGRLQGFEYMFLPDFIEVYGLNYPDRSLEALGEITRLVSAEFAVRPFLLRYPEKAMEFFHRWSQSTDANVRRLSSEGCRPRLPWASLIDLEKDPSPILPILERLKEDPSLYVRKSVANNLNDISKDHPDVVILLADRWKGFHPHTDWIIRHGCRSLKKAGIEPAFKVNGLNSASKGQISELLLPRKVKVGELLNFKFMFKNAESEATKFRLDYTIDYVTASGKTSRKIFRISECTFPPGRKIVITRKRSFKDVSTRRHFPGKHLLRIIANGKKIAEREFIVT